MNVEFKIERKVNENVIIKKKSTIITIVSIDELDS